MTCKHKNYFIITDSWGHMNKEYFTVLDKERIETCIFGSRYYFRKDIELRACKDCHQVIWAEKDKGDKK